MIKAMKRYYRRKLEPVYVTVYLIGLSLFEAIIFKLGG